MTKNVVVEAKATNQAKLYIGAPTPQLGQILPIAQQVLIDESLLKVISKLVSSKDLVHAICVFSKKLICSF